MEHAEWLGGGARCADHGPATGQGRDHTAHATAGRRRLRPRARAHGSLPLRQRRSRVGVRAGVRLRAHAGGVVAGRRGRPHGRRERRRSDDQAPDRHGDRRRGRTREGTPYSRAGRAGLLLAFVGGGTRFAAEHRRGRRPARCHDTLLARLAGPVSPDRPPLAGADRAFRADDQGPHVHADRRDDRRADYVAARNTGRRAELGLPLHLDARLDVHAPGIALPRPRLGGRRVHAVRRRPRAQRRRSPADHVRDRWSARPHRVHPRRPFRPRGSEAGADWKRCVRAASERRLWSGAGLHPAPYVAKSAPAAATLANRASAGGLRDTRCGASPTRASGRREVSPSTMSRRS